jgi:type IV pilus assembly protein PilE
MIAVAVIGILASIAYPSYMRYVTESRRTDAKAVLMQVAGQLERCYTVSNDYTGCVTLPVDSENGFYTITTGASNITASTYTLSAVPKEVQATRDTECGTFTLTHTGARGAGGNDCW